MPAPPDTHHPRLLHMIKTASRNIEQIFGVAGSVAAMWHWVTADGDEVVALAPPVPKDAAIVIMRQVLADDEAVAVLFIDEAWTFTTSDKSEAQAWLASGRDASQHPNRREIVHFLAEDDSGQLIGLRNIYRTPGRPPRLGPLSIEASFAPAGRMASLLPRRRDATLQ
jgi:hypothetical protein